MKFTLSFLVLITSITSAAEIRWTASGLVSSVTGSDFSEVGVSVSDGVEIEMVYDADTQAQGRSLLDFGDFIAGRTWFVGAAGLEIQVKIDGNTWMGQMATIPTSTNVMESLCYDPRGGAEWFKVTLDASRGGIFPSFPATSEPASPSVILEFRDDEPTPANLFEVQVLPDNLSQVCEITSASGSVNTGGSVIAFNIDPESVKITLPPVPASLAKIGNSIEISWETEIGKNYRVEATSDLKVWSAEGFYGGTGATRQATFNPFATYTKRFYRVVER